jgi:hypothetical protein
MQGNSRLLTILSIFALQSLTFAFCINAPFFQQMATDIGSLAPGLDEHVVKIGIGRKGLRRNGKTVAIFFLGAPTFSNVESVAIALPNITIRLPTHLWPLLLTLFAPRVSPPSFCSSLH